jgi:hypothetical protein
MLGAEYDVAAVAPARVHSPPPGDSSDKFSKTTKGFAQGRYVHLEIVLFNNDVRPYFFNDVVIRHFLAVRLEWDFKYVERLSTDFYCSAVLLYVTPRKVNLQIADLDHRWTTVTFYNRFSEAAVFDGRADPPSNGS